MAGWNLCVAVMPPAFAGSFLWRGLYPQLALWATGISSALPTQAKNLIERISLPVKHDPSDCQSIIKRKRLKMP